MTILQNCEIHYLKADPQRPNATFDKANPSWEVQLRTTNKEQKKEWEAAGLQVKRVTEKDDDDVFLYWRVDLKKRKYKADKTESSFVEVVDGKQKPIDPNTVGNGSIANVRVFQYESNSEQRKGKTVSILMGLQITTHKVYVPRRTDAGFQDTETRVIPAEETKGDDKPAETKPATPSAPAPGPVDPTETF